MKLKILLLGLLITACSSVNKVELADKPKPVYQKPLPQFQWPVLGGILTRHYKHLRRKRVHEGIDLASHRNTPIYAAESGVVKYRGSRKKGFGKLIIIKHRDGEWETYYAHLNKYKVRRGQKVNRGQLIGLMGRTGRATGTHLHFEIRRNNEPVNPMEYLPFATILTHSGY